MMLADMGARVIRVERPGGEDDRYVGLKAQNGENFTYPGLARGKKAITLDISRDEGRGVLSDLVSRSDIFLHNFSPGAAKAMKLSYDDLRAFSSTLIYTGISSYGVDGPYAERNGFDPIAQVASGAASLTGFEQQVPLRCGVPWVDYSTGLCAALGTVLALRHRDSTGEGQEVNCALLQTAVSYTAPAIAEAVVAGRMRPRLGNRAPYLGPADLYKCSDGYVYVAPITSRMWRALMTIIGQSDLIARSDLQTDEQRFEQRTIIDPLVEDWMEQRTVREVVFAMESAHIPCGVNRSTDQVADDPQVIAGQMLAYLDLETPGLHRVPVTGLPVRLSKTPGSVASRSPGVGEHNHEIYGQMLGYGLPRIAALQNSGVI
jgi:crotonobetainyl-CoA:carnitine CoA-transferase CaiB-like acyl-CoA transferase